jgi:hypothetical protein
MKLAHALRGGAPWEATLPGRDPALQGLMRWMLQPEPAQRPSAAQLLQYISEQGAVLLEAAAAAGAAASAPEGALAAAAAAPTPFASPSVATLLGGAAAAGVLSLRASPFACSAFAGPLEEGAAESQPRYAGPQQQQQGEEGGMSGGEEPCRMPPCPFLELSQESSGEEVGEAGAAPGAGPSGQQAQAGFTFAPLPQPASARKLPPPGWQPGGAGEDGGSAAATPLTKPARRGGHRAGGLSGAAARRAAAAAGGLQRWVPSLSPLMSEGALTPGALGRLCPFSAIKPPMLDLCAAASSGGGSGEGGSSTPGSAPRSASTPGSPMLSPAAALVAQPAVRNSTDSREGWRLSRRDMVSPDSEAMARECPLSLPLPARCLLVFIWLVLCKLHCVNAC